MHTIPQRQALATDINAENMALLAGVKPAVRSSVEPEWLDSLRSNYLAAGMTVELATPKPGRFRPGTVIVCVSRDPAVAKELATLEDRIGREGHEREQQREINFRIGELLGYPSCCNKQFSFEHVRERWWQAAVFGRMCMAWVPRPHPRLDVLRFAESLQLISFDPCRFDCAAASALADRIAAACAEQLPEAMALLDDALAQDIAMHRLGMRAIVQLQQQGEHARIAGAQLIPACSPDVAASKQQRFVERLLGKQVSARGWVLGSFRSVRVVPFRSALGSGG